MTNPSGKKGTAWETAVERFLAVLGADRRPKRGALDQGDLHLPEWVLECKNERRADWAAYVDEATAEARNAGKPYGAAVVKRRRGPGSPGTVETGYVVMSLATFLAAEQSRAELRERLSQLQRQAPGARWLAQHEIEVVDGPLPTQQLRDQAALRTCGDPDCYREEHRLRPGEVPGG